MPRPPGRVPDGAGDREERGGEFAPADAGGFVARRARLGTGGMRRIPECPEHPAEAVPRVVLKKEVA
jgi:hypothetical protein